jgi:glutamate-1-semialdehyde 2,1-aminomutase
MSIDLRTPLEHAGAKQLLPGGLGRSTFAVGGAPPVAVRGEGCRLWDDAGKEVIDLNNNFTALVHGHAHPKVVAAAERALRSGSSFGLPNPSELRHARLLLGRLPEMDLVRYVNSGTEAMMLAVRVARAHTGREACIFVRNAYHGSSDAVIATGHPRLRRGLTEGILRDVVHVAVNDAAGLKDVISKAPDRFAALCLDFMANRAGLIPLDQEFIELAQSLSREHGIVLIADEIVSFRLHYGGLAAERGAAPELMALGKLIGGGLPTGALVGRAEVMAELDPTSPGGLEHGGTFSANPVVMEAGAAALELLDEPTIDRMNRLGNTAREQLAGQIRDFGWEVRGAGSLFRPFPCDERISIADCQLEVWWEAYHRGILLTPNALATISSPMDENIVASVVERLTDAISAVVTGRGRLTSH